MQLQARLVHAEPGHRVVEVSAQRDGQPLGSALGEGATAEEAEDRALARLQTRLVLPAAAPAGPSRPKPSPPAPTAPSPAPPRSRPEASPAVAAEPPAPEEQPQLELPSLPRVAAPAAETETLQEPPPDPEDWSSELTQLDLELRRLGWQREQESIYLERAFGHPSRSRLTTYADLQAYLQALQALEPGNNPAAAPVPLRRRDLLAQCDALLAQLQWDAPQGRQFLERHFSAASRQQLSDAQLLQFNMLLESELIGV
jgi:hypothetical protein